MTKSIYIYENIVSNYNNNTLNDIINNLSQEEFNLVKNIVTKQVNKQTKILNDETDYIYNVIENKLQPTSIFNSNKLFFGKFINVINKKIYMLIDHYVALELTEEILLMLLYGNDAKNHNITRLNNLITFYKSIINTLEHYIYLASFKIHIAHNTYNNITSFLTLMFIDYNDVITENNIKLYHKSLFRELNKHNIPYLNLPKIILPSNNYTQTLDTEDCYIQITIKAV
jgi:hypothetical protein